MTVSFKRGCRGPVIVALQEKLGVSPADGVFGRLTQQAVRNVQREHKYMESGDADSSVFEALGIPFPDEFLRCMNLTSALEGTGFSDCNERDIDGFGVTMGIVGFTSRTGEVQTLLGKFVAISPNVVQDILGSERFKVLKSMIDRDATHREWMAFCYNEDGHIRSYFADLIHLLGKDPEWRALQVDKAKITYWGPSQVAAKTLGITSMLGRGLMYDGFVQSGGWRQDHQKFLESQTLDGSERTLLRAIARSYAARATMQWRRDVLSRKMLFVDGAGSVHGGFIDTDNFAFEQL